MNYNATQILTETLANFPLSEAAYTDFDSSNEITMESIENAFPNCKVYYGVTKLCIIPEDTDYVIKIPFYSYDDTPLHRAYYVKDKTTGDNYCKAETQYYAAAADHNVQDFFAETKFIGSLKDTYPVYIQEKCETIYGDIRLSKHRTCSVEKQHYASSLKEAYDVAPRDLDDPFVYDLVKTYGEEKTCDFLTFLKEFDITDLHSMNYGYCGGRPVLMDYSGYNEDNDYSSYDSSSFYC